ncbi:MAG: SDR family oxidoreductase [Clostridiales Family XIII bacterium]|nr:SDR family oxidoreductase [Clostridiales Family XIII bacterium]
MKVFVTGGTGFIGSAVVKELVAGGHDVVGLARSAAGRRALEALGASALDGDLEDAGSLRRGAEAADAAIHMAFVHNFAEFAAAGQTDKRAIEAIGEALALTGKQFVVTSGVPGGESGHVVTERDKSGDFPRMSESAALPFAERGVRVTLVRPSRFVYGEGLANGFIAALIGTAAQKGVSAYVGDGGNRIHAVNVLDLARLYLLALEKGVSAVYQGVGDGAVRFRDVAEAIGARLGIPTVSISAEQAAGHFGFLGQIAGADNPASSELTQAALGWGKTRPSLLETLRQERA